MGDELRNPGAGPGSRRGYRCDGSVEELRWKTKAGPYLSVSSLGSEDCATITNKCGTVAVFLAKVQQTSLYGD